MGKDDINIYLSVNNREQVIKLPVVPKIQVLSGMKNETFETIAIGDIKMIGLERLKRMTLQSFFPSKKYRFARDRTYTGWEICEIIESWKQRRIPVRLIATNTPINIAFAIENFDYGIVDGSRDVEYKLDLEEFPIIRLDQVRL